MRKNKKSVTYKKSQRYFKINVGETLILAKQRVNCYASKQLITVKKLFYKNREVWELFLQSVLSYIKKFVQKSGCTQFYLKMSPQLPLFVPNRVEKSRFTYKLNPNSTLFNHQTAIVRSFYSSVVVMQKKKNKKKKIHKIPDYRKNRARDTKKMVKQWKASGCTKEEIDIKLKQRSGEIRTVTSKQVLPEPIPVDFGSKQLISEPVNKKTNNGLTKTSPVCIVTDNLIYTLLGKKKRKNRGTSKMKINIFFNSFRRSVNSRLLAQFQKLKKNPRKNELKLVRTVFKAKFQQKKIKKKKSL